MAGRPLTRERQRLETAQAADMETVGLDPRRLTLPTEPRPAPIGYSDDLPEEAVLLGAQGLSEAATAAHWNVSVSTVAEWVRDHPELGDALARARAQETAWWEMRAHAAIRTGDNRFPAGAWSQVMRARFPGYGERLEVRHSVDLQSQLVMIDLRGRAPTSADVLEPDPLADPDEGLLRLPGPGSDA